MDRRALADFLRHRRAALAPEQVGLTRAAGPRRRTPGLRREEVAWIAGMSTGYYERLEQARGSRPSPEVLAALSAALQLTAAERDHLLRLSGVVPHDRHDNGSPTAVRQLLDGLEDVPAYVVDAAQVVLAQNTAAVMLLGDLAALPAAERSTVALVSGPRLRCRRVPGQEPGAFDRHLAARLRVAAARAPDPTEIERQVRARAAVSTAFAAAWSDHDVRDRAAVPVGITHPVVGDLDLTYRYLLVPDSDLRVVLCTTQPGSVSQARLVHLLHSQPGPHRSQRGPW
jgi:transcriptional regulator with XRE-family HTH domain